MTIGAPRADRHPLLPVDLASRRRATAPGTSLGALADGLADELGPLLGAARLPIPERKARLTRAGGRCPVHGSYLAFDPYQRERHVCDACGRGYEGPEHDDWWAMGAQLWTVERAVHAAALYALRGHPPHRALAERILGELAACYRDYPNRDNVLGPTRPFFSTYLESIWLLNVCQSLALLECAGATTLGGVVRDAVIAPSRTLIASYPEGGSNRQVWNGAALLAAAVLLDDAAAVDRQLMAPDGVLALLRTHCGADGGWYEGENYHLFAHRGLWYVMQAARAQGHDLPEALVARFHAGFRFPFSGLLPDETFPSRRDSQYRVSIRQWRIAEYLELGYAWRPDAVLAGLLTRVYDGRVDRRSDGRARSMADAERNEPPMALTRASLSWRALLMASPEPVPPGEWTPASAARREDGLAVIRRERARVFVGLEGGGLATGHGHPDALALTLQVGTARWLEDPGTGSYVDPSLFWYRSTVAHHAPLVDLASPRLQGVVVRAFEDRGGAGWMTKRASLEGGVSLTRTVVVADGYLVDLLEWEAPHRVRLTLPLAARLARSDVGGITGWSPGLRDLARADADGFGCLSDGQVALIEGTVAIQQREARTGELLRGWYAATGAAVVAHAMAPDVPGTGGVAGRLLLDTVAAAGRIVGVWTWAAREQDPTVSNVDLMPAAAVPVVVTTRDGTRASHGPAPHGWHIALEAGGARSSIDLEGMLPPVASDPPGAAASGSKVPPAVRHSVPRIRAIPPIDAPLDGADLVMLGSSHYVPTEEPWGGDNAPTATVALAATSDALVVRVAVHTGHPIVTQGGRPDEPPINPLDNEPADVNADGLQWYVGHPDEPSWQAAELVVPVGPGTVRRTTVEGALEAMPTIAARCPDRAEGWTLQLIFPRRGLLAEPAVRFHLTINERPKDRERRRGQLRLAGGGPARYLAGPREDAAACPVLLHLPPVIRSQPGTG